MSITYPTIQLLGQKAANARLRDLGMSSIDYVHGEHQPLPDYVLSLHTLSPGSVLTEHPDVTDPFGFVAQVGGRRAHVVVAREYGDVVYPAWLTTERRTVRAQARAIVHKGLAGVLDWIESSQKALVTPCPACKDAHDGWYVVQVTGNMQAVACDRVPDGTMLVASGDLTVENAQAGGVAKVNL